MLLLREASGRLIGGPIFLRPCNYNDYVLTNIKLRAFEPITDDAVQMLLGCHQRIRHFTGVALRLAENPGAPAEEIRSAAAAVLRYYTVALPLHEADENESLHPRLKTVLEGELARANDNMVRQHADLDALIAELVPLWRRIEQEPASVSALAPALSEKTGRLARLWQLHLELEEKQVVPAISRHLDRAALDALADEMRARRR